MTRQRGRTVGVVQARMGSTRLPGKPLLRLGSSTALELLVRRLQKCSSLDDLVIATSALPENDAIDAEGRRLGVGVFRGAEDDVVQRLWLAGRACDADAIVRLTADDALMDPQVVDFMADAFDSSRVDCVTSLTSKSFPNGFVLSVFDAAALGRLNEKTLTREEREHVVPGFLARPSQFTTMSISAPRRWQGYSVGTTLDTADDLELMREIVDRFDGSPPGLEDLLKLLIGDRTWSARARRSGHYWSA
jgi:spore coat polysaccharide biosynthesis protein SpsF